MTILLRPRRLARWPQATTPRNPSVLPFSGNSVKDMRRGDAVQFDHSAPTAPSPTRHLRVSRGSSTRRFRTGQKQLPIMPHYAAHPGRAGRNLLACWIT